MLQARGLRQRGRAFRYGLEKELATKDDKIWALEQELEAAKKLAKENENARRAVEEQIAKMREDFADYHWWKTNERNKVLADAQKVVNVYKELI